MPIHATLIPVAALAAIAALSLPAAASARAADRDHDHMPDRWEVRHHLNTHRNDAQRDADHDGLRNLAEFRAGTDPRRADSDGDGLDDGDEQAGTVASFSGGVLTLTLFDGSTLTATVTGATEIECADDAAAPAPTPTTATTRHDGGDDRSGEDAGDAPPAAPATAPATTTPAHDAGDDHGGAGDDQGENEDEHGGCTPAALVPGARVDEAVISLTSTGKVFRKIELG